MKKIKLSRLLKMFAEISEKMDLFLPIEKAGKVNFSIWEKDAKTRLDVLKTVKSPKDAFFPQSEELYSCKRDNGKLSITPAELMSRRFVLFGVKACDVRAIDVLDRVFLEEPVDTFYKARREAGIVVSLACFAPSETCFCKAFEIDCTEPGADVSTWIEDDFLYWQENTDKGKNLTELLSEVLEDADKTDEEKLADSKKTTKNLLEKLPLSSLSLEGWGGDKLEEKFNSPIWEELYKPCLACGTCTFVCPTCQCYDIKDYNTGKEVKRYRCWDSCMYSDFTLMAHGNNRTSQMQRFRQRFMHKLVYFPANNDGMFSCVGCGRCVEKCPSSLNIVKVIKRFQSEGGTEK